MKEITIKAGEFFIYITKYGGVVKGRIESFTQITSIDTQYGAYKKVYGIKSTKGVHYELNEIEICSEFITDEECKNINAAMIGIQNAKLNRKEYWDNETTILRKKFNI